LVVAATAALCLVGAGRLGLDASFEALLPQDTPSVVARQEARRRIGSADLFVIAAQSPDPPANYRFTQALAAEISRWPETEWVMDQLDLSVFRERALLFMDLDDLQELVDLVELKVLRGQCEVQGNCTERDLRTDEERRSDEERLRQLGRTYDARAEETAGNRDELAARFPELADALMSPDGTTAIVLARLSTGTNDIERARRVFVRGEALIAELDPRRFHDEMRAQVSGAYRSFNELNTVLTDATTASLVSLALIVLVVLIFLRRLTAVLLVAGSVLLGVLWTVGFTSVTYPTLNTVTAVIFGILLGMGIDYSIHLCVNVRTARRQTGDLAEALAVAVAHTTPAMMTSALTTAAALLTLATAHNRGFREFGLIGAAGVLLCWLSAQLLIPPLWGLLDRWRPDQQHLAVPHDGWMARRGPWLALALVVLGGLLAWRAPHLPFEYDLSNLGAPRKQQGISYSSALRTGRGSSPAALLGDSEEELRRAHRYLTERRDGGDDRLRDIVTVETFLPSQQEAKLEEVERLRRLLRPRTLRRVAERHRAELQDLARMAEIDEPLTFGELPHWVQRTLRERDGTVGHVGYLYVSGSRSDARLSRALQEDYASLDVGGQRPLRVATSPFVIADVVYTMQADGRRMVTWAFVAVLVLLLVDLRRISGVLACLTVLALGIMWAFGLAELLGWKLGVFNMLVLPVALGLGIDGTIHIYHRYQRLGPEFARSPLGTTGLAVFASSVTTLAGFSGLLAVQHRGLQSIGQLALVTVGATLLAVVGVLPGYLIRRAKKQIADRNCP
jgi:predicted RND superfamily exporter protein